MVKLGWRPSVKQFPPKSKIQDKAQGVKTNLQPSQTIPKYIDVNPHKIIHPQKQPESLNDI